MRQVNLVLIGPPGSGKGTQAGLIRDRYGVPAISTGDILRAAVKARTLLGDRVKATMEAGDLVSDPLMIALVRDRLAERDTNAGFILDGFPRTIGQAHALDALMRDRPLQAIVLSVPDAELERRLSSRRICSACKTLYTGGTSYGSEAELCSRCGALLLSREDDNEQTVRNRLVTYHRVADPLIHHYRERSILSIIDGFRPTSLVTTDMFACIDTA
jgi:adenylate kinase